MQEIIVSLEKEHRKTLSERQEMGDANSQSEALRRILDEYAELQTEDENRQKELNQERDREERTVKERWQKAGIAQRLKWCLFGMDSDD